MTLDGLAKLGIDKVRKKHWADISDYVKMDIINGERGPWLHLYSRSNIAAGFNNPRHIVHLKDDSDDWEPAVDLQNPETT